MAVHDQRERLLVRFEVGREPALVADGRVVPLGLEDRLEIVEDLGGHAESLPERVGAHRHDHEFLDVHVVVGVLAAVEDVGHRHGDVMGDDAADVPVKGKLHRLRGRLGAGERDAEDRVGAEGALVFRSVQGDHRVVDLPLVEAVHADDFRSDLIEDVADGLENPLAEVPFLVPVPQLQHLVLPGRGAGGDGGPSGDSRQEGDLGLDGRIAA